MNPTRERMTYRWWNKTEPLYRRFAPDCFVGRNSAEAEQMYCAETFGGPQPSPASNRYAAGKRNMDATVSMWYDDIEVGTLMKFELIDDKSFAGISAWLNRVLWRVLGGKNVLLKQQSA